MSKIDDIKVNKLIHSIALKYNMSDKDMANLLGSPYEFTKEKIKNLDFSNVETEEELNKLKTNFIYPSFFKLVVEWWTIKNKITRRKHMDTLNIEKWKK